MVELNTIVVKVLDNRLSDLSEAADGCIDALSKKMFVKSFVSGQVKDSATSIDILLKNFKSHIKVGKLTDIERKIEDFLTILSDIGGPLAEASSTIRLDIEKEMGVPFPSTGARAVRVRNMVEHQSSVHVLPDTRTYATQKARQDVTLTDTGISEHVTADSVTLDCDMEIPYDTQPVPVGVTTWLDDNNHDPHQLVHASIGNGTMSYHCDSQLPANQSTRPEMAGTLPTSLGLDVNPLKKSTQATSSAITSPQEDRLHPGFQESTNNVSHISQVTKAGVPPTLPTPGDQQPRIPRVGTYTPRTFKHHNSCPGCDELKNLKEKLSEEQRSENIQLRKKIDDLQHALDDMHRAEKEKLQENWKRIEEREKNLHEDKTRIEEREKNLHEDKKQLRKDTIEEEKRLKDEKQQMNEEFMKKQKQMDENLSRKQKQLDTELLKKQKQLDIKFNKKCKELEEQKKKQGQCLHEEMEKRKNSLSERSKKLDEIEVTLNVSRARLDQDCKKVAEKEKELRRLQSKLTEQKQEIDKDNKFLNDRKIKEIEEISKEKQKFEKREHELKLKWEEYWKQRRVLEKEKEGFKKELESIKLEKQHHHSNKVQVIKIVAIFSCFLILVFILCYRYTFN